MRADIVYRKEVSKELGKLFPNITIYERYKIVSPSSYDKNIKEIPIVKECIKLSKEYDYEVSFELYIRHKVLDIIFEDNKNTSLFTPLCVISFDLISNKVVGFERTDKEEGSVFFDFIDVIYKKYISSVRSEIGLDDVFNNLKRGAENDK